jgi:hypothetical protein
VIEQLLGSLFDIWRAVGKKIMREERARYGSRQLLRDDWSKKYARLARVILFPAAPAPKIKNLISRARGSVLRW